MLTVSKKHFDLIDNDYTKFLVSKEHGNLKTKVLLDSQGGNVYQKNTYVLGEKYGTLPEPERTNNRFLGWFKSDGTQIDENTVVQITDKAIYAGWVKDDHRLYTELQYIQSNGQQYINTNINVEETGVWDMKVTAYSGPCRFFGNTSGGIVIATPNSSSTWVPTLYGSWDDTSLKQLASFPRTNVYNFDFKQGTQILKLDGEIIQQKTRRASIGKNQPIYIFIADGGYRNKTDFYYAKIYGNGVLKGDFIPVKDRDDIVCMYDKVTEEFFYNQGTGNFIAGPEL